MSLIDFRWVFEVKAQLRTCPQLFGNRLAAKHERKLIN